MTDRCLTFGSLFAGIGGLDLGLERAGMVCRWQVEIDDRCQDVLARHWPDVPKFKDVRDASRHNLAAVDLICGGFPCQDLSVAGRRAGLAGNRSGLFYEFMRVVADLAPRWVLIENVPGLLSSNRGRDMGTVIGTLGQLGYGWAYRVLDAQHFGVAQRRRRVFIVGCLGGGAAAAQVLFEPESLSGHPAPSREAGQDVAGTLGACANRRGWNDDTDRATFVPEIAGTLIGGQPGGSSHGKLSGSDRRTIVAYPDPSYAVQGVGSKFGSGRDNQDTFVVFDWQSGGDVRHNVSERHTSALQASQTPAVATGINLSGLRGRQPGSAATFVHEGIAVRRLTPTECERLQGFPDGHTDGQADSTRYRQLGNAVAVPCAAWIGRRIVKADHD